MTQEVVVDSVADAVAAEEDSAVDVEEDSEETVVRSWHFFCS